MASQDLTANIEEVTAGYSSGEEFEEIPRFSSSDEDEDEDEYEAVEVAAPLDFVGGWKVAEEQDVAPQWLPPSPLRQSGPTVALDAEEVPPSGLFRQFIGDDLLDEVAVETNRYAGTEGVGSRRMHGSSRGQSGLADLLAVKQEQGICDSYVDEIRVAVST